VAWAFSQELPGIARTFWKDILEGYFGRIFWTRYLAARGRMWVFRSEGALTF
jgi:hypothetical protein